MAQEVFVPKTGIYMDDVYLLEWLIEEGGYVEAGQPLFRMETNKVEQDIEAEASGYVHQDAAVGAEYAIGTVIGWIAPDQQSYQALATGATK